jgi:hypothetical protein
MRNLAIAVILLLMTVGHARAITVTYTWTEPTTGTPVVYYEVGLRVNSGDWESFGTTINPTLTQDMPVGVSLIRVRGVDEFGRAGVWSTESEPFIDMGAPGGCGIINRIIEELN